MPDLPIMTILMDTIPLGKTGLFVSPLGLGTAQWGDATVWGYGREFNQQDAFDAFTTSVQAGITFIDTAEIYGRGMSERITGECVRGASSPVVVATKLFPFPTRLGRRTVNRAIDSSLKRLGLSHIDLYQVHWPAPFIPIPVLMNILADAVEAGKLRHIGVSNYSAAQMRQAHEALAKRGLPLASNQVEYSLLKRAPEVNGVMAACRELNVTLIAYSPLAHGLLTGKYTPHHPPPGMRRVMYSGKLKPMEGLIRALAEVGQAHGKTPAQVALNWLMRQGNADAAVLPIPGAKNARQAEQNAGALGWQMTEDESERLRTLSAALNQ